LELRELPLLLELEFEVVDAMRLEAESGGQRILAINEVVLIPAEPAAIMRYSLHVDGAFIFNDMGDGCLVSTPVGSTAYALSAGGAVISPRAQVVEVVAYKLYASKAAAHLPSRRRCGVPRGKKAAQTWSS
jgi:Predicted sugar kinase